MQLLLSLALSLVLLMAVSLGPLHHHEDGDNHPDCAICATAQHVADELVSPLFFAVPLLLLPMLFIPWVLATQPVKPVASIRSRAPPR
jgi:hypothetical protein